MIEPPRRLQMRECSLHAIERAQKAGSQRLIDVLLADALDRPHCRALRIVDQHIQAPEAFDGGSDRIARVLALAHVASNGQHAYTERLQLCGRALQLVLLSAGQYEIRALGRERFGYS